MVSIAGVFGVVHRLTCSVPGSCGVFFLGDGPFPLVRCLVPEIPSQCTGAAVRLL